ncbi:hypothetical protein [Streptomyces sp. NPDC057052]|uniref:hypothetical protein n=1 Tax=Streptomyces sp. NPDC057052 TaxID=3346010 RepID=UPI00363AC319
MTDDATPRMPDFPPQHTASGPAPETAPVPALASASAPTSARMPRNGVIIGAAAAVIAAVIGTGIFVVQAINNDDGTPAAAASSSPAASDESAVTSADEPASDPVYTEPAASDFTMTLRTTEKQCFGSAGCNLTVEPRLTYTGVTTDLDPDAVYEITYEIKGDESGPVIETAELSDRTTLNYTQTSISTASSGTKVSVEITEVTTQGA